MSHEWGVWEWETGTLWSVSPPNQETARAEAALCGLGHEAVTKTEGLRLKNAWSHGRMAAVRRARQGASDGSA